MNKVTMIREYQKKSVKISIKIVLMNKIQINNAKRKKYNHLKSKQDFNENNKKHRIKKLPQLSAYQGPLQFNPNLDL